MCPDVVSAKVDIIYDRSGETLEVNLSDHEYEVEYNKRNRREIPRGGGGKKWLALV